MIQPDLLRVWTELAAPAPDERVAEVGGEAAMYTVTYVLRATTRLARLTEESGSEETYLHGRASAHTDGVVEIGVCTAFLGVYAYEIEFVPHSVNEPRQAET